MKQPGGGAEAPAPWGTTFLFSDIEGSTKDWDRDRAAMQEGLSVRMAINTGTADQRNGRCFGSDSPLCKGWLKIGSHTETRPRRVQRESAQPRVTCSQ